MPETVISLARIQREAAVHAANPRTTAHAACPYPMGTDAAHAYLAYFAEARAQATTRQPEAQPA